MSASWLRPVGLGFCGKEKERVVTGGLGPSGLIPALLCFFNGPKEESCSVSEKPMKMNLAYCQNCLCPHSHRHRINAAQAKNAKMLF